MAIPRSARMGKHVRRAALLLATTLAGLAHAADADIGPARFFQNPRMTAAEISPDGQTVALASAPSKDGRVPGFLFQAAGAFSTASTW